METNAARDRIFARIRAAQGRGAKVTEGEREAVADYLNRHPQGPRPAVGQNLAEAFSEQAQKMASTVDRVATLADVPGAVLRYLDGLNLARRAVAWTALGALPWAAQGIEVECRPPLREPQADREHGDLVGITGCFVAIAETGSLMLLSGPDTFASAALLPETHIAVVPVSRIV
uniref:LUD domain-containing protein n=2 Tax=cellular organisms TaxID=131567 RepID=A0A494G9X2_SOLLC